MRSALFEDGDFAALLLTLPGAMQPVIQFLRFTGWCVVGALGLTWDQVDWEGGVIRLTATATKGKSARLFPLGASAPR